MPSSTATIARNRVGGLTRSRSSDDPELVAARLQMAEAKFVAAVERALAAAPPLRPEIRERVVGLLTTANGAAS